MDELNSSLTEIDWLNNVSQIQNFKENFKQDQPVSKEADTNMTVDSTIANTREESKVLDYQTNHTSPKTTLNNEFTGNKPGYSYSYLISLAIESSTNKKMKLKDIYEWISYHFPYYKNQNDDSSKGWKNAIRHNLSLNECFVRVSKEKFEIGKGCYWTVKKPSANNSLMFGMGDANQAVRENKFQMQNSLANSYVTNPIRNFNNFHISPMNSGVITQAFTNCKNTKINGYHNDSAVILQQNQQLNGLPNFLPGFPYSLQSAITRDSSQLLLRSNSSSIINTLHNCPNVSLPTFTSSTSVTMITTTSKPLKTPVQTSLVMLPTESALCPPLPAPPIQNCAEINFSSAFSHSNWLFGANAVTKASDPTQFVCRTPTLTIQTTELESLCVSNRGPHFAASNFAASSIPSNSNSINFSICGLSTPPLDTEQISFSFPPLSPINDHSATPTSLKNHSSSSSSSYNITDYVSSVAASSFAEAIQRSSLITMTTQSTPLISQSSKVASSSLSPTGTANIAAFLQSIKHQPIKIRAKLSGRFQKNQFPLPLKISPQSSMILANTLSSSIANEPTIPLVHSSIASVVNAESVMTPNLFCSPSDPSFHSKNNIVNVNANHLAVQLAGEYPLANAPAVQLQHPTSLTQPRAFPAFKRFPTLNHVPENQFDDEEEPQSTMSHQQHLEIQQKIISSLLNNIHHQSSSSHHTSGIMHDVDSANTSCPPPALLHQAVSCWRTSSSQLTMTTSACGSAASTSRIGGATGPIFTKTAVTEITGHPSNTKHKHLISIIDEDNNFKWCNVTGARTNLSSNSDENNNQNNNQNTQNSHDKKSQSHKQSFDYNHSGSSCKRIGDDNEDNTNENNDCSIIGSHDNVGNDNSDNNTDNNSGDYLDNDCKTRINNSINCIDIHAANTESVCDGGGGSSNDISNDNSDNSNDVSRDVKMISNCFMFKDAKLHTFDYDSHGNLNFDEEYESDTIAEPNTVKFSEDLNLAYSLSSLFPNLNPQLSQKTFRNVCSDLFENNSPLPDSINSKFNVSEKDNESLDLSLKRQQQQRGSNLIIQDHSPKSPSKKRPSDPRNLPSSNSLLTCEFSPITEQDHDHHTNSHGRDLSIQHLQEDQQKLFGNLAKQNDSPRSTSSAREPAVLDELISATSSRVVCSAVSPSCLSPNYAAVIAMSCSSSTCSSFSSSCSLSAIGRRSGSVGGCPERIGDSSAASNCSSLSGLLFKSRREYVPRVASFNYTTTAGNVVQSKGGVNDVNSTREAHRKRRHADERVGEDDDLVKYAKHVMIVNSDGGKNGVGCNDEDEESEDDFNWESII